MTHRTTSWNTPYTFSGKEKDVETGYGYFGARYNDSGLSIWLSVDPMSDKYPSMSPYNYCANNPVMIVDPDGEIPVNVVSAIGCAFGYALGDLISQTISNGMDNLKNNKGFFNKWGDNVDWADVGVSFVQSGVDGFTLGSSKAVSGYAAGFIKAGIDVKEGQFSMFMGKKLGVGDKHRVKCAGDLASNIATEYTLGRLGMDNLDFGGYTNNWAKTFSNQSTKAFYTGAINGPFSFAANAAIRDPFTRFLYMNFSTASVSAGITEATEIQIDSYKAKLTKYSNKYWYYENQ